MTHHFVSYSSIDEAFARRLATALREGSPPFVTWLDKDNLRAGIDWDSQISDAVRTCHTMLFLMSRDSVQDNSTCKQEWTRALKYKKPVVPLRIEPGAELPFRLEPRQYLDFTGGFDAAVQRLREHLGWLSTPDGRTHQLRIRRADAERDLRRTEDPGRAARIREEIQQLDRDIADLERVLADPAATDSIVRARIARAQDAERIRPAPAHLLATKFVNPPPGIAPPYFENRTMETQTIEAFLADESRHLLTVIGRGGTGKTVTVCRVLKSLESGKLAGQAFPVRAVIYLSGIGSRRITIENLVSDLVDLLPTEDAAIVRRAYRDPQFNREALMELVLEHFRRGPVVILMLDNFESIMDPRVLELTDPDLAAALTAVVRVVQHTVKVIITSRLAPRSLGLVEPARQVPLHFDDGLPSPYAENVLRGLDAAGTVGLRDAPEELLRAARERTRGIPRALEALFAILAADRDTTLREIVDAAAGVLPDNVQDVLVGEAFSRLDRQAQQVMEALAVYGRPVAPTAVDHLLQPYVVGIDAAPILGRLVNWRLVHKEAQTGRYLLHPTDRAYALGRIPEGAPGDRSESDTRPYTRFALLDRAAGYFRDIRKPRWAWRSLDDIGPQLAEFELRCAAHDFDTAAVVLLDIDDDDHLRRWRLYRLAAELHQVLQGRLTDRSLAQRSAGCLGSAYFRLARYDEAIASLDQALAIADERGDLQARGWLLGYLGDCLADLGDTHGAAERYRAVIAIARDLGDLRLEAKNVSRLARREADLGEIDRALAGSARALELGRADGDPALVGNLLQNHAALLTERDDWPGAQAAAEECLDIGRRIGSEQLLSEGATNLARLLLYSDELEAAQRAADTARQYDQPDYFHYVLVLAGVIALRKGDPAAAGEAFTAALERSELLLTGVPHNFGALEAKGLGVCGLLAAEATGPDRLGEAVDAFHSARAINRQPGVVRRVLRLLDQIRLAAPEGRLVEARRAAARDLDA